MLYPSATKIVASVGTDELAAATVLLNVMLVAILPGLGLGLASASLVDDVGESHFQALTAVIGILTEAVENPRAAWRGCYEEARWLPLTNAPAPHDTSRSREGRCSV